MAKTSKLATAAAAVKKNLLGSAIAAPKMVEMPQAVHEIHVSIDDVIPPETIITDEIAALAGLKEGDIADLIDAGAVKLVEVYASAVETAPAETPDA